MSGNPSRAPQVLVVGAGPVGLAAAIELGQRGIETLVVERNDRVGYAPRAKTTNVRTREHLRRWGIADKLAAASPLGVDYPSHVLFVTRLAGHLLTRIENANYCAPGRNPLYSEHAQWIPQYTVEEVLRAHAQALPTVRLHFGTELVSFAHDAAGVEVRLRDVAGGSEETVRCAFLIGADGARSTVRSALGIAMNGVRKISRHYNVVFRAPGLDRAHRHGPGIMYWQVNDDVPSLLGPMDSGDRWFFGPTRVPDRWFFGPTRVPDGVTLHESDMPALIRRATGIDLSYEILSSDEWTASRLIADRYRDGRVLLAGDACHLHPPFGGYGMNMGISDAVDLGWKIAAVLQGWGGAGLLDSYEAERKPVHNRVMDEAVANHALLSNQLWREGLDDDSAETLRRETGARIHEAKLREFDTLGVVLGYRYDGSPIIVADGSAPPSPDSRRYVPSACPGGLAPHAWLADGTSLYDHFGRGYTLLSNGGSADHERAAMHAAAELRLPLTTLPAPSGEGADLYAARFALIRPDQHVAWRGDAPDDWAAVFARVTGR
jgi:2-polyprenyl-6-methoxyphenol hydroxylase-like FAD-dependent oxidoreductase